MNKMMILIIIRDRAIVLVNLVLIDRCVLHIVILLYKQVMPAVINLMKEEATLITLVKPQFEARRSQVDNLSPFFHFCWTLLSMTR